MEHNAHQDEIRVGSVEGVMLILMKPGVGIGGV